MWTVMMVTAVQSLQAGSNEGIDACLKAWGKHPFSKKAPVFRTLDTQVKVLGIGGNVVDSMATKEPELILINHSVAVMSKQSYELLNPNGWYCIRGSTAVLGKSHIKMHCKAHLASTIGGTAVLGNSQKGSGAVTVLGNSMIEKVGCTQAELEAQEKAKENAK